MSKDHPLLSLVVDSLADNKADDIVTIDLTTKSKIADFMVVATGQSKRHINSLAFYIETEMKKNGYAAPKVEGLDESEWVLIDAFDVIIHVFCPEAREFYNIEKMWSMIIPEALQAQVM